MKFKMILVATLLAIGSAQAVEVGVIGTRDYSSQDRTGYGITLGQKFGAVGVTGGFEHFTKGTNDQDRYSVVVGYDVTKVGSITVTPKIGVAYLNNETSADGYAMTFGVGTSLPITKQVSLTADISRQYGQHRVNHFDGNLFTVGAKYAF